MPSKAPTGRSPSASQTASIASIVRPPEKTASLPKSTCSPSSRSAKLHSMVALKVRCLSGRSRAPPVRSFRRLVSLCSIALGGSGGTLVGYGEVRPHSLRPLHEQPHRLIVGQTFQGRWTLEVGQCEGRNRELMLAVEPQGCAAGCQNLQAWSPPNQLRYGSCRLQNLLEVVEHEQQPPLAQVVLDGLLKRLLPCLPYTKRLRNGREEQLGFSQGC